MGPEIRHITRIESAKGKLEMGLEIGRKMVDLVLKSAQWIVPKRSVSIYGTDILGVGPKSSGRF